ncbi:DUF6314 family protein [Sinomonas susongensis]|uniref:DUF6314 family protein n=1 Tax=Sinomonas susongensis TaxID=1324851 RepID=UPI001109F837|nr:DUF6314 family protein [Sinomonas susongensis]
MSYSVPDLSAYLSGVWTVERTLVDRATGARGTFSGTVTFGPPETAGDDGALLQRESGRLRWGQHEAKATREYVWRPTASPDTMDVFFPDGRFFHTVRLGAVRPGAGDGGDQGPRWQAEHWCAPDDYRVAYTVLGPDELQYEWDVRGPRKDQLLTTRLRRDVGRVGGHPSR